MVTGAEGIMGSFHCNAAQSAPHMAMTKAACTLDLGLGAFVVKCVKEPGFDTALHTELPEKAMFQYGFERPLLPGLKADKRVTTSSLGANEAFATMTPMA
ncbi:unnamed protein product [Pleuronectes platessa]|uniref:Uncharacterized protein n=1 Tax=Pleuronectes platessa TaxID=8262 RepID=A0A9N7Y6H0_PLEPL|nr:unnamed protein product [Pleuronectes platessa]